MEKRYECAERALYRCKQLDGESNESFLARADVMWAELLAKGLTLSQLQAYAVLRGSRLSAEDKKRVLVEGGAEGGEELSIVAFGAGFFEELATGKKTNPQKVYDSNAFLVDGDDADKTSDEVLVAEESGREDEFLEALWTEGDEDANLVCEYEFVPQPICYSQIRRWLLVTLLTWTQGGVLQIDSIQEAFGLLLKLPLKRLQRKEQKTWKDASKEKPAKQDHEQQLQVVWTARAVENKIPSQGGQHEIQRRQVTPLPFPFPVPPQLMIAADS